MAHVGVVNGRVRKPMPCKSSSCNNILCAMEAFGADSDDDVVTSPVGTPEDTLVRTTRSTQP